MAFTQYTTMDGERWDSIAQKAYGDPFDIDPIIKANPMQAITPILPGGTVLLIPIIESSSDIDESLLPPWKQNIPAESTEEAKAAAPLFLTLQTQGSGSFSNGSFD